LVAHGSHEGAEQRKKKKGIRKVFFQTIFQKNYKEKERNKEIQYINVFYYNILL